MPRSRMPSRASRCTADGGPGVLANRAPILGRQVRVAKNLVARHQLPDGSGLAEAYKRIKDQTITVGDSPTLRRHAAEYGR